MSKKIYTPVFILIFSASCTGNENNLPAIQDDLELIAKLTSSSLVDYERCIVLPQEGCYGCIKNSTAHVIQNLDSLGNSLIVFTAINDFKKTRRIIGDESLLHKNVIIDTFSDIVYLKRFSIYPHEFVLEDGKVVEALLYDPF